MKTPIISKTLPFFLLLIISCSYAASADSHDNFLQCLSQEFDDYSSISNDIYTPANSSYTSVLLSSVWNKRFATESMPKPQVIMTPELESQIPPIILCARKTGLEIRVRSAGHDFEGLSISSKFPFLIIDMINLREITVDAEDKTAWIRAGATFGELYHMIAEKSSVLAFPGALGLDVGVGGSISGGGHGPLTRKYGLFADNILDARIVDVNGRILDRKSMGEDLFWAIRGGGGASFGVILAWKVQLVDVPERVSTFSISRSTNASQLVQRWQYVGPQAYKDLYIGVFLFRSNATIQANFFALFLGGVDRLLTVMQESFPELRLRREECSEMSWINSTIFLDLEQVGTRVLAGNYKGTSDYVQTPIPQTGFDGLVRMLFEPEADQTTIYFVPYGGRMNEISESETPFPHRAGNLYIVAGLVSWRNDQAEDAYLRWSQRYYAYMAPYVSKSPRQAYLNYRDLEIGANNPNGKPSYARSAIFGRKYFKNNFDRLVRVKTIVDPTNFFKNEQSIPPLSSKWTKKGD
ncbi:hypothetical protein OROHE_014889 [Orobanche hederae]